ncbi:MAG: anti-sigma factor [bacterium]
MLDKNTIISSQLLEQYALGTLSIDLIDQVEEALLADADLRSQLQEIEISLENIALENTIDPPAFIKENILSQIPDKSLKSGPKNNNSLLWIAASVAALLGFLYFNQYSQNNELKDTIKSVEIQNETIQNELKNTNELVSELESLTAFLNNPSTDRVVLNGNTKSPNSSLVSYYNNTEKKVLVTTNKLEPLSDEHDYQMWADVDGEMINMGIIDTNKALLAMQYIPEAESFNITIEPKGGSDHPTVSELIANTYLSK